MSVSMIDGRYESLERRTLAEGVVRHVATTHDGSSVVVDVYDVSGDQEPAFEAFRRALKALARRGDALVVDVVARPGAHYVVWQAAEHRDVAEPDAGWRERLMALGLDPARAELTTVGRRTVLVGMERDVMPRPTTRTRVPPSAWTIGRRLSSGLLAAFLLLLATAAASIGAVRSANARDVVVPDVVGRSFDAAVDAMTQAGLVPTARPVVSMADGGTVLATDPAGNVWVRPGRHVTLDVAVRRDGSTVVEIPDVVSMDVTDATERFEDAGLTLGDVARVAARRPLGVILAQRPAPGERRPPGSAVSVVVSAGPDARTTFLPDLVGVDESVARAIALDAGFARDQIVVDPVAALDVPVGTVVAMTPAPWHGVRVDDVIVRFLVADPTGSIALRPTDADASRDVDASAPTAPDLVGLPTDEALRRARAAALEVDVTRIVDSALPTGVVAQSPAPGSTLAGGLVLTVNQRPVTLPRPTPTTTVLLPRPRDVAFEFFVEPGIPEQTARILATTADGVTRQILERRVVGGDTIAGTWQTIESGPIDFALTLNDIPYADRRVTDPGDGVRP